jgi:DNA topoisomerase-6 subunit A
MSDKKKPVLGRLEGLGKEVVDDINRQKNPSVDVLTRALSNVKFNEKKSLIELGNEKQKRYFFNVGQAKKFMQTFLIASACKTLLNQKKTTSIRDLYYITKHTMSGSHQNTFDEQEESDPIIEDLEVMVNALREELNLFASNRGALVGSITIVDSGDTINCRKLGSGGWSIPSIVEKDTLRIKDSSAKFILMVEKDAVWRRLNEDKFWLKHNCILIHGQGMAPRGVRRLLHRLVNELNIPLYVLVDNDPWGFYIYSVIKQGSINLAYESMRMAVPAAKFVGLSSFDREKYGLSINVTIKLDDQDRNRAKQILDYPWFHRKEWQREIRYMLKCDVKLELEALSQKGISFVSEEYLPKKLRNKEWLD